MEKAKYPRELVAEGDRFYDLVESVPAEERHIVKLVAEAFINGLNAGERKAERTSA